MELRNICALIFMSENSFKISFEGQFSLMVPLSALIVYAAYRTVQACMSKSGGVCSGEACREVCREPPCRDTYRASNYRINHASCINSVVNSPHRHLPDDAVADIVASVSRLNTGQN